MEKGIQPVSEVLRSENVSRGLKADASDLKLFLNLLLRIDTDN